MRPAEFADQDIVKAGQELSTKGRAITGFALRQRVGGGNPTRLLQVWEAHLSSQAVATVEPVADLPVEVSEELAAIKKSLIDRLESLASNLNDRAVKAAERRVRELVKTAGEQRSQADREVADAALTVEDLERQLDQLQATADGLNAQLAQASATRQTQAVALAQLEERLAAGDRASQAAASQHAGAMARAQEDLRTEQAKHHQEVSQLGAELAQQEKIHQAVVAERGQLATDLAACQAQLASSERDHEELLRLAAADAKRAQAQLDKVEAELDQARKEASLMRSQATQAREEAAGLRGQAQAQQAQVADLMGMLKHCGAPTEPTDRQETDEK